ncbi:sn-glycerol-1-phosphate dehydrogenase [Gracilibacillus sp. YIM 98692]|uniref:sn-glycerol-1-phosphate dehydrogenase n=1 Tax=Gracilibacillus sp. YIM 98692 TaxID=2663532 RepID=UPI0013D1668B|nr:sn-glycerol-1-phosphate dehydrogenase [Gracilibacillus sp. YIM 98692]
MDFYKELSLLMEEEGVSDIPLPDIMVGNKLKKLLSEADIQVKVVLLSQTEHQQVVADEQTIVELFLETTEETDILIAAGTGTIHDIRTFCRI